MKIKLNDSRIQTIQQVEQVINSGNLLDFKINTKQEAYDWIESTLIKFKYYDLRRKEKGSLKKYIQLITGYSRSQVTRQVGQYLETGEVKLKEYERNRFQKIYSERDIELLATTDDSHNYPNGNAIKKILKRERDKFGKGEYENIANISVAHIYNLRKSKTYRNMNTNYNPTKPNIVSIGERRKPEPKGEPGYLRVDSVHQGDKDGVKGVYHINTVDEVLQFEMVGAVEKIADKYLVPLLEQLIDAYPFEILEFHADNGSEYINKQVAKMLNRLLIKLTKNRSRKTNDNALVEGKNGSVIRKHMGYMHIDQKWAEEINHFYFDFFNPYLNFHRPCAYATEVVDKKGKIKKIYKQEDYKTPYEALKQLKNAERYLKPGVTFKQLDKVAYKYSDNEWAKIMKREKTKLFEAIRLPDLTELKI